MPLIHGDEIIYDFTNLYLYDNYQTAPYYSTTSATKGSWYFEYEHIQGTNTQVMGYECTVLSEKYQVTACPQGSEDRLYLYSNTDVKINGVQLDKIDLNYTDVGNSRVGVAIDIDSSLEGFVFNDEIRSYSFDKTFDKCKIMIRNLSGEDYKDNVSVFLTNFLYKAPFDALPWGHYPIKSCKKTEFLSFLPFNAIYLL